jgi:predicted CoA-binding protein
MSIFATSIIIMTNQNNYIPAPVDTTDVQLPEELMALAEAISKNVHEVWAQNRIKEGWTYGPVRDDAKRQTPCLVPYEQLPEEEKAYDRNTAFGTLKFIVSQGFEIIKKT